MGKGWGWGVGSWERWSVVVGGVIETYALHVIGRHMLKLPKIPNQVNCIRPVIQFSVHRITAHYHITMLVM